MTHKLIVHSNNPFIAMYRPACAIFTKWDSILMWFEKKISLYLQKLTTLGTNRIYMYKIGPKQIICVQYLAYLYIYLSNYLADKIKVTYTQVLCIYISGIRHPNEKP